VVVDVVDMVMGEGRYSRLFQDMSFDRAGSVATGSGEYGPFSFNSFCPLLPFNKCGAWSFKDPELLAKACQAAGRYALEELVKYGRGRVDGSRIRESGKESWDGDNCW
jgi:hypothetical protein